MFGSTKQRAIRVIFHEYVNMIMMIAITTAADLTNEDTLIERPSCTIWVSEMILDTKFNFVSFKIFATYRDLLFVIRRRKPHQDVQAY
jgi:hypothetical protein